METNKDGLIPGQEVDFATLKRIESAREPKPMQQDEAKPQEAPRRGRPAKEQSKVY